MSKIQYGYEKTLTGTTFEQVVERVTEALKKQEFGVLTKIDVKNTLKEKLNADFRKYQILGACNPRLSHQALDAEPHIGLLLPCNVVVQESEDGGITVSIAKPKMMFKIVKNPALDSVVKEADHRLRGVMEALG